MKKYVIPFLLTISCFAAEQNLWQERKDLRNLNYISQDGSLAICRSNSKEGLGESINNTQKYFIGSTKKVKVSPNNELIAIFYKLLNSCIVKNISKKEEYRISDVAFAYKGSSGDFLDNNTFLFFDKNGMLNALNCVSKKKVPYDFKEKEANPNLIDVHCLCTKNQLLYSLDTTKDPRYPEYAIYHVGGLGSNKPIVLKTYSSLFSDAICSYQESICINRDEDFLVIPKELESSIEIWNIDKGVNSSKKTIKTGDYSCFELSPKGDFLAIGLGNNLKIFDIITGKNIYNIINDFTPLVISDSESESDSDLNEVFPKIKVFPIKQIFWLNESLLVENGCGHVYEIDPRKLTEKIEK